MNKSFLTAVALMGASVVAVAAPKSAGDTAKVVRLQEVEVTATRATKTTPVAFTNVSKEQIAEGNFGKDIPALLSTMPSVQVTSDAGAGIGYSSLRVRGTDPTRVNITTNDIPMNDAESHEIYWVNTPDFASSLQDIQIQRGAGTSTNGSGAFGASVNMRTQRFSMTPYAEVSGSYGSFNTNKETIKVGSGLIGGHWAFDARFSHLASAGYRDRASSKLHSYFAQAGYFNGQTSVRFITFGGKETTYHAWDGISKDMLTTDRTYNPNGEIKEDGKVVGFYNDQTDNYRQTHYQLIWDQGFGVNWHWNLGLHYTDGFGYYQEYKNGRTLAEYGLTPFYINDSTKVKKSSLVRKKNVDSGFGGGVFSLKYAADRFNATFGGGINYYANDHWGNVIWVENYIGTLDPNHEYYRNKGKKQDYNFYLKANYDIWKGLSAYVDLQYRHINYKINGENDKWDYNAKPEHMQTLDINETFNFFNPKAGLFYKFDNKNSVYASFAVAQKEPTRNNYTDGSFTVHPTSEKMYDYELGYRYESGCFNAGVNLYYMKYKNQLVLNGKLNEIGEAMSENVPNSFRMGIELQAGMKFTDWLRWDLNGTLSRNRIQDYTGYVSNYDADWNELNTQTAIYKGNTTIAMSPSFMGNSVITFNYKGFMAQFTSQYTSRQYLDNFENKDDSLDPYFVSNLNLAYTFKLPSVKAITIGCTIYNIFNEKYENNGYSQTVALFDKDGKNYTLVSDPRFYAMAGTNVLAHITLSF